jgi:hypothetical protein
MQHAERKQGARVLVEKSEQAEPSVQLSSHQEDNIKMDRK